MQTRPKAIEIDYFPFNPVIMNVPLKYDQVYLISPLPNPVRILNLIIELLMEYSATIADNI